MALITIENVTPTLARLNLTRFLDGSMPTKLNTEIKRVLPTLVSWQYATDTDVLTIETSGPIDPNIVLVLGKVVSNVDITR